MACGEAVVKVRVGGEAVWLQSWRRCGAHRGVEEWQDAAAYHELYAKVQPQQRRQHERTQRAFERVRARVRVGVRVRVRVGARARVRLRLRLWLRVRVKGEGEGGVEG